jgi:hypothetical protein
MSSDAAGITAHSPKNQTAVIQKGPIWFLSDGCDYLNNSILF